MKKIEELMLCMQNGEWVPGIRPDVSEKLTEVADKCFRYNSLPPSRIGEREALIRQIVGRIGERFVINSPFHCDFGCYISIGENFVANFNLTILDEAQVTIGDNVFLGPNCSIYTIIHALTATERNEGIMTSKPVSIGDDVWISGDCKILPGVEIGAGCVIGAGSVVTKSIPAGVLAVGNPCKVVRKITDADRPHNLK